MNTKKAFFWLLYSGIFFLVVVWERVQASRTYYVITQMQNEINVKQAKLQHLKFENQKMKSPARLQLAAAKKLNMSLPSPDKIIYLENHKEHQTKNWLAKAF